MKAKKLLVAGLGVGPFMFAFLAAFPGCNDGLRSYCPSSRNGKCEVQADSGVDVGAGETAPDGADTRADRE